MGFTLDESRALELLQNTMGESSISPSLKIKIQQFLEDTKEQECSFKVWGQYIEQKNFEAARQIVESYIKRWGIGAPNISYMETLLSFLSDSL